MERFGEGNDFLQWAISKEKKGSARKQELILPTKVGKDQKKTGLHLKIELIFHSKLGVDQKKGLRRVKTWFLSQLAVLRYFNRNHLGDKIFFGGQSSVRRHEIHEILLKVTFTEVIWGAK